MSEIRAHYPFYVCKEDGGEGEERLLHHRRGHPRPRQRVQENTHIEDIYREHVKKIAFLAENSAKALPPPPRPPLLSGTLCIFFYIIGIWMFLKPANSDLENGKKNLMSPEKKSYMYSGNWIFPLVKNAIFLRAP